MSTVEVQQIITVNKRICDFCGKVEDFKEIHMNKCWYCGKDVCNKCILEIKIEDPSAYVDYVFPCPECKDLDIGYLLAVSEYVLKKEDGEKVRWEVKNK